MAFYVAHPSGFTKGRASRTINIVFLAEGFFPHRETVFLAAVESFSRTFVRTRPFSRYPSLFTISAIFTPAAVSLAHLKRGQECDWRKAGPGQAAPGEHFELGTPFGALFCRLKDSGGDPMPHTLAGNMDKVWAAIEQTPELEGLDCWPVVLVDNNRVPGGLSGGFNSPGGLGSPVAWLSLEGDWIDTAIHEMGHSIFNLGDEYDSDGPARHPPVEPGFHNVTLARSRDELAAVAGPSGKPSLRAWRDMMAETTLVPTSEPNPGCSPVAGQQKPRQELGPGATGLFEGANHSPCGVFRPALACRMRHQSLDFCPVCEWAIERQVARLTAPLVVKNRVQLTGLWTNILSFDLPGAPPENRQRTTLMLYNGLGAYALHQIDPFFGDAIEPPLNSAGAIDGGWTSLVSVSLGGRPRIMAHSLLFQRLAVYEPAETPAGLALLLAWDSGAGGYPFTHFAAVDARDGPIAVGYHSASGALRIDRVSNEANPLELLYGTSQDSSRRWQSGLTLLLGMKVDDRPFVLKHHGVTGEVIVQSLDPPGWGPTSFASRSRHWGPGVSCAAAYEAEGRTYVVRAAAGSYLALDWVWPGATGVELMHKVEGLEATIALSSFNMLAEKRGETDAAVGLVGGTRLHFMPHRVPVVII